MEFSHIIYIGVIIYLLGMLAVGLFSSKKISGTDDFLLAGRRLPLWLCTAALSATFFGGGTILGAGGAAYGKGFIGGIADPFGAGLCLFLAGLFFIRIMRRMRLRGTGHGVDQHSHPLQTVRAVNWERTEREWTTNAERARPGCDMFIFDEPLYRVHCT